MSSPPLAGLSESDLAADPIAQFDRWMSEAIAAAVPEPTAATLATVGIEGAIARPSCRTVLVKGVDRRGFFFYTNYQSRKGRELAANPSCSLLFHWKELQRQAHVEGVAERVARAQSQEYFDSRPLASRHGAHASPQSTVIPDREWLDARHARAILELGDHPPCPENWGGYRLAPRTVEFWQGRESRLHDRLRFTLRAGTWLIERLAP